MNLTTDPWIPAVGRAGAAETVSLREAFERGDELRDLAVRPHERIALMRLLICIAQAALDGPSDYDDWKSCRPRIAATALDYLKRWKPAFELFGAGGRFLQLDDLTPAVKEKPKRKGKPTPETETDSGAEQNGDDGDTSTSKLDLALATGNNPTLFDNAGGSTRAFAPADLALMLVTFQCFSPGGRIRVALWNGIPTQGDGSSNHAPCMAGGMLHAMPRGESLLDSIHRNLTSKEQATDFFGNGAWGRPVWERMPSGLGDASAVQNATRTYLGRLAPLTRAIRLADDGVSLLLANGLDYPSYPEWREPSSSIIEIQIKKGAERRLVGASIEKAVWRELHALTVGSLGRNEVGGPAALQNLTDGASFDLWVGGFVANKAKPVEAVESVYHVPAAMLDESSRKIYEEGVRQAEIIEQRVRRAVSVYHKVLGDELDRPESKKRRQRIHGNACRQFWTDAECAVPRLLEAVAQPATLGLQPNWFNTPWGKSIRTAADNAYRDACPHATPRQMRAFALGLRELRNANDKRADVEAENENENDSESVSEMEDQA